MGSPVARIGDLQSHGGVAITGSPDVFAVGQSVHRHMDLCYCPLGDPPHGIQPLVTASGTVFINGRGCGRIGDSYACGAIVVTGAPTVFAG